MPPVLGPGLSPPGGPSPYLLTAKNKMNPVDENVMKTYDPRGRNQGKDNTILEETDKPNANIDEQMVAQALRNVLPKGAIVRLVGDQKGPPDISVNDVVAVEVKGPDFEDGGELSEKLKRTLKKALRSLRDSWRATEGENNAKLRRHKECWVAVTIPRPVGWVRFSGFKDADWERMSARNREQFDWIMEDAIKGSGSLREPVVSRILLLAGTRGAHAIITQPTLYVYNTKTFEKGMHPLPGTPAEPRQSAMLEGALALSTMSLTSGGVEEEGRTYIVNELKARMK